MSSISDTARANLLAELTLSSSPLSNVDLMALVRAEKKNLITNPSIEVDLAGFSGANVSNARSLTWSADGNASLEVKVVIANNDSYANIGGDIGGMRLGMVAGKTYTISATINTPVALTGALSGKARSVCVFYNAGAGYQLFKTAAGPVTGIARVSTTFTLPENTTEAFVRLYNGSPTLNEIVYWDALLLEEGTVLNTYFDGDSADTDLYEFSWSGVNHNSLSIKTGKNPEKSSAIGYWQYLESLRP